MGVLVIRVLLHRVYIRAPDFWKHSCDECEHNCWPKCACMCWDTHWGICIWLSISISAHRLCAYTGMCVDIAVSLAAPLSLSPNVYLSLPPYLSVYDYMTICVFTKNAANVCNFSPSFIKVLSTPDSGSLLACERYVSYTASRLQSLSRSKL